MRRSAWLVAMVFAGLIAGPRTALRGGDSPVKQVSYTTGQNGSTLKWLPARGSQPGAVVRAAATARVPVVEPAGDAAASPPGTLRDASDGAKAKAAPPGKLNDDLLEKTPAATPLPKLSTEEPQLDLGLPKSLDPAKTIPDEEGLVARAPLKKDDCAEMEPLKPLNRDIVDDAKPKQGVFPPSCPMGKGAYLPRQWQPITFHWTASALCSKPNYWEDVQLERYGHTWGPWLQPLVSAGHFFLVFPAVPYAVGLFPPHECVYTLGYYRPGSCAPYMLDPLPLSVRAALAEGGVGPAWSS